MMMFKTLLFVVISFTRVTKAIQPNCSHTMLNDATGRYIAAQSSGSTSGMTDLANVVNYTENSKPMNINRGVLASPLHIDHSTYFLDTELCASFTELIINNPSDPYVIGTRMLFSGERIATIESIVTKVEGGQIRYIHTVPLA